MTAERITRWSILVAVLVFWALSLRGLDALPLVREDEPWQAAPGYSWWTRGIYGSDLFRDFAHMDEHYYLFQPTFSLVVGAAAHFWGLGLYQLRLVPVMLGTLTLCLTYALGTKVRGPLTGGAAAWLLLLWRWSPSQPLLASGVLLLDQSRIARYDALVPVWGLAAWYVCMAARTRRSVSIYWVAGGFIGLAGLAHLYGLFWLPALGLGLLWDSRQGVRGWRKGLRPLGMMTLGVVVVWLPWLLYIAGGWADFVSQTSNYAARFDVLNVRFYIDNLVREPQRYGLGRTLLAQALTQPGVWLLVLGVPAAEAWLWRRALDHPALRILWVPALIMPTMFGWLLQFKIPGYLLSVAPLFALLIAEAAIAFWRTGRRGRGLLLAATVIVALDGGAGMAAQQVAASKATAYYEFMAEVRAIVPQPARVLAMSQYWPALAQNDFRSYADIFFLTNPEYTPEPMNIEQALQQVEPDVIILDSILGDVMARGDDPARSDPYSREFALRFHAYMDRHNAREVGRVSDATFGTLVIYRVTP
jgi:hypothetical protein